MLQHAFLVAIRNLPGFSLAHIVQDTLIVSTSDDQIGFRIVTHPKNIEYPILQFNAAIVNVDKAEESTVIILVVAHQIQALLTEHANLLGVLRVDDDFMYDSVF